MAQIVVGIQYLQLYLYESVLDLCYTWASMIPVCSIQYRVF